MFGSADNRKKTFKFNLTKENDIIDHEIHIFLEAHYDKEMCVVDSQISCFSYWKVFEKRFVDYLHMTIITKLLFDLKKFTNHLDKKFSPSSNEQAFKWINED